MKKILNILFYVLKFILFLAAFGLTLFIILQMNRRLEKDFMTTINIFIPFAVLLILFIVNLIFKHEGVTNNLFYNLTCCLVFATIIYVSYRAICDKNMVLNEKYGYGIDFNYFSNFVSYLKIMLYGLAIGNIFFMFNKLDKGDISSAKVNGKVNKNSKRKEK